MGILLSALFLISTVTPKAAFVKLVLRAEKVVIMTVAILACLVYVALVMLALYWYAGGSSLEKRLLSLVKANSIIFGLVHMASAKLSQELQDIQSPDEDSETAGR